MNLVVKIELLLWRRFKQCCLPRDYARGIDFDCVQNVNYVPRHTAPNTNLSAQALYDLQHGDALTMAFATLGLIQLFHAFNVKSIYQSIFKVGLFRNKSFNYGILVSFLLLVATIVIPGFNDLFSVTHLDAYQWAIVALLLSSQLWKL